LEFPTDERSVAEPILGARSDPMSEAIAGATPTARAQAWQRTRPLGRRRNRRMRSREPTIWRTGRLSFLLVLVRDGGRLPLGEQRYVDRCGYAICACDGARAM